MIFTSDFLKNTSNIFISYMFVFKEIKKASRSFLWVLIFSISISGFLPPLSQYILKLITSRLEANLFLNTNINSYLFVYLSALYMILILLKALILNVREYVNNIASFKLTYSIQTPGL